MDNALRKSYDRCVQDHDIAQISRMLSISRLAQIHGHALPADVMELIEKCARFELDVSTSLRREGQGAQGTTSVGPDVNVVDLPVRLVFDPAWRLTGEQSLDFVSYTISPPGGNTFTGFQNGLPFRVERLMFDINLFGPAQQNRPRQLEMLISHGSAAEHTQAPCPTCQAITYFVYYAAFSELHASERIAPAPGTCTPWIRPQGNLPPPTEPHLFLIKGWATPGGALFARKTYDRRKFGGECAFRGDWVERTTLDLFHTPG